MADTRCFELIYPSGVPFVATGFEDVEIGCFGSRERALLFAHQGVDDKLGIPMARQRPYVCSVLACAGCDEVYDADEGVVHFEDRETALETARQIGWLVDGTEALCPTCKPTASTPADRQVYECDGQEPLFGQVTP